MSSRSLPLTTKYKKKHTFCWWCCTQAVEHAYKDRGEAPHQCKFCDFRSAHSWALAKHRPVCKYKVIFICRRQKKLTIILLLAWEPSAVQVTKSYSCHLPALKRFYRETKILLLKSTKLTLNLKIKLWTFPWVFRVLLSKFEANRSMGCWFMIGQTNRDYNFIYILYNVGYL